MRTAVLLILLAPTLLWAQQQHQPYQSPATVAKRLKEQCAPLTGQRRAECDKRARTEVRASIARHHEMKSKGIGKQPAKGRVTFQKAERRKPRATEPK